MRLRRNPTRAPLRAVVALSILFYCAVLLVPGSAAYFTSGAGTGGGSFGTASCATLLQVPGGVTVQGLRGSGYNGFPVKITSLSTIPLPLSFSYQGADPPSLSTYANTIPAGGTTTVYLSGTLQQTANGALVATIGNHFDTCAVSVSKTAVTYDIHTVITLTGTPVCADDDDRETDEQEAEEHRSDQLKADRLTTTEQKPDEHKSDEHKSDEHKVEEQDCDQHETDEHQTGEHQTGENTSGEHSAQHLKVLNIAQGAGQPSVPLKLKLTAWYVPSEHDDHPSDHRPAPVTISSPTGTFSSKSAPGTDVYVDHEAREHAPPLYVTITVLPGAAYVDGSQSYCFVLGHSDNNVQSCPATVPPGAVYLSS